MSSTEVTTCPDGQINSPENFINFVDSNCVPFTTFQLILFCGGCLMWVVAYGIIIRNAYKYHWVEMAAIAAANNFGWEIVWSFPFTTDMGWFMGWTYRAWFFFDIFIIYTIYKYGARQWTSPFLRKNFNLLMTTWIVFFTLAFYFFTKQGLDTSIGATSAYTCQLILSALCFNMLGNNMDKIKYCSLWVAVLRSYGTGVNTIFMFLHYPENHYVHVCGCTAFIFDNLFIYHVWKGKKALKEAGDTTIEPLPEKM